MSINDIWIKSQQSPCSSALNQAGNKLTIVSDGHPNPAKYGKFPTPNNPNKIFPFQFKNTIVWRAGTVLTSNTETSIPLEEDIGIAINGAVIQGPGTLLGAPENNLYKFDRCADPLKWSIDAYGGTVNKKGIYHYVNAKFITAGAFPNPTNGYKHPNGHSKIVGVSYDGFPIYGPYGYSDPNNVTSQIKSMASGYRPVAEGLIPFDRPQNYPIGTFVQDYIYIPGIGDLDESNGRFCKTPDYPNGTYAYFMTVDERSRPVYPYIIGPTFKDTPVLRTAVTTTAPSITTLIPRPVWATLPGQLATITEGNYFEKQLQAIDPAGVGLKYAISGGSLPPGMQLNLSTGLLAGVPLIKEEDPNSKEKTYIFTVRATTVLGYIVDQDFSITITDIQPPVIVPDGIDLGSIFDGSLVDLQLQATFLNPSTQLKWNLHSGSLPPGLMLSEGGILHGYLLPQQRSEDVGQIGWANAGWDQFPWNYAGLNKNQYYEFYIRVDDGSRVDIARYSVNVISKAAYTADNSINTIDVETLNVDADTVHQPVIITQQTNIPIVREQSYFSFKFEALDFDGDDLEFTVATSDELGFDYNGVTGFDAADFDQSISILPSGIGMDSATGWLTGYISSQVELEKTYTFKIFAYKKDNPTIRSEPRIFTLTVLRTLDIDVTWSTPGDLGTMATGDVSEFQVEAVSTGRDFTYRLKSGAANRLPQGLKLLESGLIIGQASFRTTLFDFEQYALFPGINTLFDNIGQANPTKFDTKFTFTIEAIATDGSLQTEKTFSIELNQSSGYSFVPHEDIYMKALVTLDQRRTFDSIINNPDLFPPDLIYRSEDPWFGKADDIKFLFYPGATPATAETYLTAMAHNFYTKTINFGNIKTAVSLDENLKPKYEVVYVEIIDEYNNQGVLVSKRLGGRNPHYDETGTARNTIYPNSLMAMQVRLEENIGYTRRGNYPDWMLDKQADGRVLGLTYGIVLAYTKPGASNLIAYRLKDNDITFYDLTFKVDRFLLDDNLSKHVNKTTGVFYPSAETTFDRLLSEGSDANALFNRIIDSTASDLTSYSTNAGSVNYAVTVGFNEVNNRSLYDILLTGEPRAYAYGVTWQTVPAIAGDFALTLPLTSVSGPIIPGDIVTGPGIPYGSRVKSYDGRTLVIGLFTAIPVIGQYVPVTLTFSNRPGLDGVVRISDGDTLIFANQNNINNAQLINVETPGLFDDELFDQGPSDNLPSLSVKGFEQVQLVPEVIENALDPWTYYEPRATFDSGTVELLDGTPIITAGAFDTFPIDESASLPGYKSSVLLSDIRVNIPPVLQIGPSIGIYELPAGSNWVNDQYVITLSLQYYGQIPLRSQLIGFITSTGQRVNFTDYISPTNPLVIDNYFIVDPFSTAPYFNILLDRPLPVAIPQAATLIFRVTNQRAGVWRIRYLPNVNFDDPNFSVNPTIKLEFVKEIQLGQKVKVLGGQSYGGTTLQYTLNAKPGQLVPEFLPTNETLNNPDSFTIFDGNGTRFYNARDEFTEPEIDDKYIIFPHGSKSGVFK